MQRTILSMLGVSCAVLGAQAAEEVGFADVCNKLEAALEQQVDALASVSDAASAAASIPAIQKSLAAQKSLFGVNERELWNYIDHTEGVKTPLMRVLQRLAAQVDRLKKANFYGNMELKKLLL